MVAGCGENHKNIAAHHPSRNEYLMDEIESKSKWHSSDIFADASMSWNAWIAVGSRTRMLESTTSACTRIGLLQRTDKHLQKSRIGLPRQHWLQTDHLSHRHVERAITAIQPKATMPQKLN